MNCVKYGLLLPLLMVLPTWGQTAPLGKVETKGQCSPAVSGDRNTFIIKCAIGKEQGDKMLAILNKILANQLDPKAVMEKLDEILKAVNPNLPTKAYLCNGMWRTAGPGAHAAFEISMGGDDSAFKEMVGLVNAHQYQSLLEACLAQIRSTPDWLTPRLFCGVAYLGLGDKESAKKMLSEFGSKAGPAYSADACKQMSDFLHQQLQ